MASSRTVLSQFLQGSLKKPVVSGKRHIPPIQLLIDLLDHMLREPDGDRDTRSRCLPGNRVYGFALHNDIIVTPPPIAMFDWEPVPRKRSISGPSTLSTNQNRATEMGASQALEGIYCASSLPLGSCSQLFSIRHESPPGQFLILLLRC
jgi:hypothetical protein